MFLSLIHFQRGDQLKRPSVIFLLYGLPFPFSWTDSGYLVCQEPRVPSVLEGLAVQGGLLNGAVTWDLVSVDEPGQ